MSYSQNVTKLTEYDYLMGTASNTWYYKLNASIDSLNKLIDTLQAHRAMLYENLFMYNDSASLALVADAMYARSGGSPVDTNRLLPFFGETKIATGRMILGDTLRAKGIDAPCDTCSQQTFVVMPHGYNDGKFVFTDKRTDAGGYFTIRINRSTVGIAELFLQGINSGNLLLRSAWSRIDMLTGSRIASIRNTCGRESTYGALALGTGSADHITLRNGGDIGFHTDTPSPYGVKFARSVFIDTTLTVRNLNVPFGSVANVDSTIKRMTVVDSTGWIVLGDSAMYRITEIGHPKYHPLNPYKSGWIKIQTLFSPSGGTGIRRFKLIADSANNVRMYAIVSTHWQGHVASLRTGIGYTNIGYSPYWVATNTTDTTQYGVYTVVPENGYNSLSYADIALNITMFTDAGINGEIIVHYHLPAAATSTFYIKMEL